MTITEDRSITDQPPWRNWQHRMAANEQFVICLDGRAVAHIEIRERRLMLVEHVENMKIEPIA